MTRHYSAALPVAYVVLRMMVVLNWLMAGAILVLLLALPHEQWIMTELKLAPSPDADRVVMGLRAMAVAALATIPLNHLLLTRLLAMVETVRLGDPFVAANARRLQAIAWILLALQLAGLLIAALGRWTSIPGRPVDAGAGLSISGWLAVLIAFVLARVFAAGAQMRDELEGTV